jgi:hypothetical protein
VGRDGEQHPADARRPARHVRDRQQLSRELERRRARVDPVDLLARSGGPAPAGPRAIHPTYQTPDLATHVQGIFGIVLAVGLGLAFNGYTSGGPITTYGFIGVMLGLLFAAMYIAVNAAAIGYFLGRAGPTSTSSSTSSCRSRHPRDDRRVPVGARRGVDPDPRGRSPGCPAPYNYAPLVVGIWMLIGSSRSSCSGSRARRRSAARRGRREG